MLRILDAVVRVSVDIVRQETDGLHVREQHGRIGQVLPLDLCQEDGGRLQISFRKGLEYRKIEMDVPEIPVIFRAGVGRRPQEIPEIREDETRHHRIQVDDTEHIPVRVEQHVVDLGVAMADPLRKDSLPVHPLRLAHFPLACLHLLDEIPHGWVPHPPHRVRRDGFAQLAGTEFHVMEIRDRLAQRLFQIREHGLEAAESLSGIIG